MFPAPERNDRFDRTSTRERVREISARAAEVLMTITAAALGLAGTLTALDSDSLDSLVEQMGDFPLSLGAMVAEMRDMGFSDQNIILAIFALAGVSAAGAYRLHRNRTSQTR